MPRPLSPLERILGEYHDPAHASLMRGGKCEHGHGARAVMDVGAGTGDNKSRVYAVTDDDFDSVGNLWVKHLKNGQWLTCRFVERPVSTPVLANDARLWPLLATRDQAPLSAPSHPTTGRAVARAHTTPLRQSQRSIRHIERPCNQRELPEMRQDLLTLTLTGLHKKSLSWIQDNTGNVWLVYRRKVLEDDYGIIKWDELRKTGRFELAGLRRFLRVQCGTAVERQIFWDVSEDGPDCAVGRRLVKCGEKKFIVNVESSLPDALL